MAKKQREETFEQYRQHLRQELMRLARYIRLYRQIHERKVDRIEVFKLAPCFFQTVRDSLFTTIVLWVENLFGQRSECGLEKFLCFVENNRDLFDVKERQRRSLNSPSASQQKPITFDHVKADRMRIQDLSASHSFKLRRDKFHAHFDKDYAFHREKLPIDAPIKWSDLEDLMKAGEEVFNRYSLAYDRTGDRFEPLNATDVDCVLDRLHRQLNAERKRQELC